MCSGTVEVELGGTPTWHSAAEGNSPVGHRVHRLSGGEGL